jgi:signal recognition particle GTPase
VSKVFEGKTGTERTLLGSGVWCTSGKYGLWAREAHLFLVLVVELDVVRAAARTGLARPGRKCRSKVFEEMTGTERTLLGSGVWCSSRECGL